MEDTALTWIGNKQVGPLIKEIERGQSCINELGPSQAYVDAMLWAPSKFLGHCSYFEHHLTLKIQFSFHVLNKLVILFWFQCLQFPMIQDICANIFGTMFQDLYVNYFCGIVIAIFLKKALREVH